MMRAMIVARLLVALAAATFTLPSLAAPSVYVDELTWTELRDRVAAGATTVIVPVGGIEQNGPHMTLGKHNARARILAGRIALALGNALVAPVVAYAPEGGIAPPTAHMRFPGTVTVPTAAFEATLESVAQSYRLAGFRDVAFVGDHGGYQASLQAVARRLNASWASTPARAHAIVEYYRAGESAYRDALRARGFRDDEIGTHAGLADTSLALAVDPSHVRGERLAAAPSAAEGTYGDPRRASAELGALGVNAIVASAVEAIRQATRRR
jgi:creatinine amidohydrolase/Fe(II)-dependent formamide hydrolase-like protein